MSADRIPCLNPRCRRTAPRARYPDCEEIICGKCYRTLPRDVRERLRTLERYERRICRLTQRRLAAGTLSPDDAARIGERIMGQLAQQWEEIKRRFLAPDQPAGLENFLAEMGLS